MAQAAQASKRADTSNASAIALDHKDPSSLTSPTTEAAAIISQDQAAADTEALVLMPFRAHTVPAVARPAAVIE